MIDTELKKTGMTSKEKDDGREADMGGRGMRGRGVLVWLKSERDRSITVS